MTTGVATESDTGYAGDSLNLTCCGCGGGGGVATLDIIRSTPTIGPTGDAGDSFAQSATAMSIIHVGAQPLSNSLRPEVEAFHPSPLTRSASAMVAKRETGTFNSG